MESNVSNPEAQKDESQTDDGTIWCEACDKRPAHAYLEVQWRMGMGGEDTDGERIACCRRCAAAILNKWDAVLEAARLEGV